MLAYMMSLIPLPIARFMGRLLGRSVNLLNSKRGRISLDNLRRSSLNRYGIAEIIKINSRIFEHFGQMLFELPHIFKINQSNLLKYARFQGEENMDRALSYGKGVFILSAHLGNWELMSSAIPLRFGPSAVLISRIRPPLKKLMVKLRSQCGMQIIDKLYGMRKILKALAQKKTVGILLDQNTKVDQGIFMDFLGRKACVNSVLAHMALKFDIPVVPVFCIRQKNGLYKIEIMPAVKLKRTGNKSDDIKFNTALFSHIIEEKILEHPEQWLWFHRRWKTQLFSEAKNESRNAHLLKKVVPENQKV